MKKQLTITVVLLILIIIVGFLNLSISSNESEEETEETKETASAAISIETTTIEETETIDMDAEYPYLIAVNRVLNRVVIYGINGEGEYDIAYLGFICSTGINEDDTPLGTFTTSDKYEWRELVDGSYGQYATRICDDILFHSAPYSLMSKDTLETEEYNKLGSCASLGCVRLTVSAAKWIYDNCPSGTTVIIYDDENEEFDVEFENVQTINITSEFANWDPTDPDEANPWNS